MTFNPHPDNSGEPYVLDPAAAPAYWFVGTYWRVLADGTRTAGRSCTFDELCPRSLVAPVHTHDILAEGTPAPKITMPAPGVSALPEFRLLARERPPAPWEW